MQYTVESAKLKGGDISHVPRPSVYMEELEGPP